MKSYEEGEQETNQHIVMMEGISRELEAAAAAAATTATHTKRKRRKKRKKRERERRGGETERKRCGFPRIHQLEKFRL